MFHLAQCELEQTQVRLIDINQALFGLMYAEHCPACAFLKCIIVTDFAAPGN